LRRSSSPSLLSGSQKLDRVRRGSRFWRNGRAGFSFLVYSMSKNALDDSPQFAQKCAN
jgi:hypothetical protein